MTESWTAYHIFLYDIELSERFLVEKLEPLIEQLHGDRLVDGAFFIRYWHGGPHLRLRLRGLAASQQPQVHAMLSERVGAYLSQLKLNRDDYYGKQRFDGVPVETGALPWWEEGAVVAETYEPEYGRYGGAAAMEISERLFVASSTIAYRVLQLSLGQWQRRLNLALQLMASGGLAICAGPQQCALYFKTYADLWAGHLDGNAADLAPPKPAELAAVRQLVQRLRDDALPQRTPSFPLAWYESIQSSVGQLRGLMEQAALVSPFSGQTVSGEMDFQTTIGTIAASQIHMLNNRLGVPPAQEHHFARLLSAAFVEPA